MQLLVLVERSEELATGFKLLPRSQRLKNFLKYQIPIWSCSLFVNSLFHLTIL